MVDHLLTHPYCTRCLVPPVGAHSIREFGSASLSGSQTVSTQTQGQRSSSGRNAHYR